VQSVRLLWENMLFSDLVHTDFKNEIADFGDTVNTRKPGSFTAKRKQNDLDDLETQDVTATNIQVVLNQRIYVSFLLGDRARTIPFKNLVNEFLDPAVKANGSHLDRCIGGQVYQFLDNRVGALGLASSTTISDYMVDAGGVMNVNKTSLQGRNMALASRSERAAQKVDLFKSAERRGDGGRALREASLGRVHGWDNFLSLNVPSISGATKTAATTTTAAALPGALVVAMTAVTNLNPGQYYTAVGDYTALRVASVSSLNVTNTRPLLNTVASGAAVQPYALGAIKQGSAIAAGDTTVGVADGYPAGWIKGIVVDGTGVPQVGQLVAFRAAASTVHPTEYCIVDVINNGSDYTITLDQPLVATLADNDIVCYGPDGDFNFGFQRPAVALITRPLAVPEPGSGVRAASAEFKGLSLRVVITYDGKAQATRVTVDGLFGLKKLDTPYGMVMYG